MIINTQHEKIAVNLGLFYLTNIDLNYVSGTGFTLVKNNQDLILEFMLLLLDNWSEEPAYLIISAKFQYGMPKLDGFTCFTF